jgi:GT2 family glycosyltransferase
MIVATEHGPYLVQGLDRFAIAGDVEGEVRACVEGHARAFGKPPAAVTWDDVVLDLRPNLRLSMVRIFIPPRDPFIARALDAEGRAALRLGAAEADSVLVDGNAILSALAADEASEIAHAPGLLRFIGWPEAAPLLEVPLPRPSRSAASIAIVINYRDKSDTTIACLKQIRAQRCRAALEIVLVNNRSLAGEQRAVIEAAAGLFGGDPRISVRHLDYDADFSHSDQCNRAVEMTRAEALVMLSNDCLLLDPDLIETIADWSLEPGVGLVGPRIIGDGGAVVTAGITLAPTERNGETGWRLQDAEVDYLSRMVRQSCGASFACAAIGRATWNAMNGADAEAFAIDYNDADFALRLSAAGYGHLYVGCCQAYHQPGRGEERTRANAAAVHDLLESRHRLQNVERCSPYAVPMKRMPNFDDASANQISDLARLYRLAVTTRGQEATGAASVGLMRAFETMIAEVGGRCDLQSLAASGAFSRARRDQLVEKMRKVCAAYLQVGAEIPERYIKSFQASDDAFARLAAKAAPQSGADAQSWAPQNTYALYSFNDPHAADARLRLLVFADRLGPVQQTAFLEGLKRGRAEGDIAVRVVTEAELRDPGDETFARLRQSMLAFRPTHCIFSHFADRVATAAIAQILAEEAFAGTARIFHAQKDVFAPSLLPGAEAYRRDRHPDRIYALHQIARGADLILAGTQKLGMRLADRFGSRKIGVLSVAVGGEPFPPPESGSGTVRVGIVTRDAKILAAPLTRLAAENPQIAIERMGDEAMLNDRAALSAALRARRWDIGLVPDRDALEPPVLWAAYAQAGIAALATDIEPHRELARLGALKIAGKSVRDEDWQTGLQELVDSPPQRLEIVRAANRLLETRYSWEQVEKAMRSLLDRAAAVRNGCANLTMADLRQARR